MSTNDTSSKINAMVPAGQASKAPAKYRFGSTNALGQTAQQQPTQPNHPVEAVQVTVNEKAKKQHADIANRVRQALKKRQSERVANTHLHKSSMDKTKADIVEVVINNIREEFMEDVREQVYSEFEPTIALWKTIVETTLRDEVRPEIQKEVIAKMRNEVKEGSDGWKALKSKIEQDQELVKAQIKAKMTSEIHQDLHEREYQGMKETLRKEMENQLKEELKKEVKAELKDEMRDEVRKDLRKEFLEKLATPEPGVDNEAHLPALDNVRAAQTEDPNNSDHHVENEQGDLATGFQNGASSPVMESVEQDLPEEYVSQLGRPHDYEQVLDRHFSPVRSPRNPAGSSGRNFDPVRNIFNPGMKRRYDDDADGDRSGNEFNADTVRERKRARPDNSNECQRRINRAPSHLTPPCRNPQGRSVPPRAPKSTGRGPKQVQYTSQTEHDNGAVTDTTHRDNNEQGSPPIKIEPVDFGLGNRIPDTGRSYGGYHPEAQDEEGFGHYQGPIVYLAETLPDPYKNHRGEVAGYGSEGLYDKDDDSQQDLADHEDAEGEGETTLVEPPDDDEEYEEYGPPSPPSPTLLS